MKYLTYTQPLDQPTIFILGFFDGLHKGHLALFQKAKEFQRVHPNYQIAVCTFPYSPVSFLKKQEEKTLFTFAERCLLMKDLGVDIVYTLPMELSFFKQPAKEFIRCLTEFAPKVHFIAGEEARFGHDQKGGAAFLQEIFQKFPGHSFETAPTVIDGQGEKISSSAFRQLVLEGNMEKLALSLYQPFFLLGKVEYGEQKGRLIGFPTLNIPYPTTKLLPPFGVYRSFTQIGHLVYHSLTYLSNFRLDIVSPPLSETWVSNFQKDIYGADVRVYFLAFHRPPVKVPSLQELKVLLEQDKSALSQKFF